MNKDKLLPILKTLSPALSTSEALAALSCFNFTGKSVHAYDDQVGIVSPYTSDFQGGIKGKLLLTFLNGSKKADIDVTETSGSLLLKSGRSKLELPLVPVDEFLFEIPKSGKNPKEIELTAKLVEGIQQAIISMGVDTNHPWRMGVTIAGCKAGVWIFSSDNLTTTRVLVKDAELAKSFKNIELLLNPRFCSLLVRLATQHEAKTITFTQYWAVAKFKGNIRLFGKTGQDVSAGRYKQMFSMAASKEVKADLVGIPVGADESLAGALAVLASSADKTTGMRIRKGRLFFNTESTNISLLDSLAVKGHKDIEVSCPADFLQRAMKNFKSFCIQDSFVLFKRGSAFHVVTTCVE